MHVHLCYPRFVFGTVIDLTIRFVSVSPRNSQAGEGINFVSKQNMVLKHSAWNFVLSTLDQRELQSSANFGMEVIDDQRFLA